jgi:hypothetical protein
MPVNVIPSELREAAQLLDAAGDKTRRASSHADDAAARTNPFGISEEADELRRVWNDATAARVVETAALAAAIEKLAEDLRAAADSYEAQDNSGASEFAAVGD